MRPSCKTVALLALSLVFGCTDRPGSPTQPDMPVASDRREIASMRYFSDPAPRLVTIGSTALYWAVAYDANGEVIENPDAEITWHSSNPEAVVITKDGVATRLGYGSADLWATWRMR